MLNACAGVPRNPGFHQYKFSIIKYTNYNILRASAVVSVDAIAFNSRSFQYYGTNKIFQS